MEPEEQRLVQRCLAGDEDACEALVSTYARMVGTAIWRATGDATVVEDLAQDTFLRAFRALPYFDNRSRLSTWIYTIAHHVAVDHHRKRERAIQEEPLEQDELETDRHEQPASANALDPEATVARQEVDVLIHEGLATLPEKYRLPLVYTAIDGMDYATVAAMLKIPTGTVKTLVFRAKQMLRTRIARALRAKASRQETTDGV